jgi:hypothetical protein
LRAGAQRGRLASHPHAAEAGIAVYVLGDSGKLAIARIYDDSDPPFCGPHMKRR